MTRGCCDSVRRLCIRGLVVGRIKRDDYVLVCPVRVAVSPFGGIDRGHCGCVGVEKSNLASKRGFKVK